jgi:acyl-CoA thioester hydrolase
MGWQQHELVVRASAIEYFAPARFDDALEVFTRVARIGTTSVTYECAAYRIADDLLMVTARQTLVVVDLAERRATPVPESFREKVRSFEGPDLDEESAGR